MAGLFFHYRSVYERFYPGGELVLDAGIAVAFFLGVFASYGAGYVGMYMAVRGNLRTAAAALTSFKNALEIAFRAGAVSGMFTVGLGLLGATIIFLLLGEKAGMQSPLGRALGLAYFAAFEGDPDGLNRALERLLAITPDDVQHAVQQYLHTTRNRTVMHIQAGAS